MNQSEEVALTFTNNEDILNPNETRPIIAVDSQVLSKIQSCNQRAAYRHLENIELIDKDEFSLEKGLVVHEGLAEFYTFKHNTPYNILRDKVIARAEAFAAGKTDLPQSEINNCIDALNGYTREYEHETFVPLFVNDEPLVEKTFAIRLYEDEDMIILYTGVTDLIVRYNNYVYPVDHKSYSSYFKAAVMSNQFHGYCYAAKAKNLIVNRIGLGSKLGKNERVIVSYTPAELEEWKTNTVFEITQHYRMMQTGWFRRNYEACEEYGGCSYKLLCNANPDNRESLKRINYRIVPEWSPLERG